MVAALLGLAAMANGCSGDESVDPPAAAFCAQLAAAQAPGSAVASLSLGDPASVDRAVAELEALEGAAPDELSADLALIVSTFASVARAVTDAEPGDRQAVLVPLREELDAAGEAATRLAEYANRECGTPAGQELVPLPAPTPVAPPEASPTASPPA